MFPYECCRDEDAGNKGADGAEAEGVGLGDIIDCEVLTDRISVKRLVS